MSDRIEVTHGGEASDEEVAAIVLALTPVTVHDEADEPTGPPAWRRAAIIEGLGGRPATSARDLAGRGRIDLD